MQNLRTHCFMHVPYEGIGCIENWLKDRQIEPSFTRFYENTGLPSVEEIDFLIVMGGPMGVYEENKYKWLNKEKQFIHEAIAKGKIVLGICLGSQLIAEVLGSKVFPNQQKEIGWFDVFKTETGQHHKMLEGIADTIKVFHWHGDTYNLPKNCQHLFYSENCDHQVFLYQDKVLGLQFHPEINPELISGMLTAGSDELIPAKTIQSSKEILSEVENMKASCQMMDTFLNYLTSQI